MSGARSVPPSAARLPATPTALPRLRSLRESPLGGRNQCRTTPMGGPPPGVVAAGPGLLPVLSIKFIGSSGGWIGSGDRSRVAEVVTGGGLAASFPGHHQLPGPPPAELASACGRPGRHVQYRSAREW